VYKVECGKKYSSIPFSKQPVKHSLADRDHSHFIHEVGMFSINTMASALMTAFSHSNLAIYCFKKNTHTRNE